MGGAHPRIATGRDGYLTKRLKAGPPIEATSKTQELRSPVFAARRPANRAVHVRGGGRPRRSPASQRRGWPRRRSSVSKPKPHVALSRLASRDLRRLRDVWRRFAQTSHAVRFPAPPLCSENLRFSSPCLVICTRCTSAHCPILEAAFVHLVSIPGASTIAINSNLHPRPGGG